MYLTATCLTQTCAVAAPLGPTLTETTMSHVVRVMDILHHRYLVNGSSFDVGLNTLRKSSLRAGTVLSPPAEVT